MDKQKNNFAENIADHVANLLRQGRESEVTNDLLHQADPHRLYQHYVSGNTGMHFPMDEKSRLERAEQMGFDIKSPLYHGTKEDFGHFMDYGKRRTLPNDEGTFLVDKPSVAEGYGSTVMPVFNRPASSVKQIDVGDMKSMYNLVPKEEKPWDGTYKSWKDYYKPGDLRMRDDYAKNYSDYISSGWDVHYSNINNLHTGKKGGTHNMRQVADPSNIRSQFARFDPRLAHLSHISAATGGYIHKEDGGPITAYHGSPHDFEQFDTSKIGTGEGAQSYGHGLYFAEHEPVAKGYAKEIAKQQHVDPSMHFDGRTIYQGQELNDLTPAQIAAHVVADNGIDTAHKLMSEWSQDYYSGPMWKSALQALQENPNKFAGAKWKHGHMYEVAIDAHPDHFLDWDKPLSANTPQAIKDSFNNIANNNPVLKEKFHAAFRQQLPGSIYYSILSDHAKTGDIVKNQKFASDLLSQHGIHGIRYLDAGSRGPTEQPTHNYVVFDHNRVKVNRKYEQGGAVGTYADGGTTHEPHKRAEEQGYSIKGYHFTRGQRAENIAKTGKFDPTRSFNPDEEAAFFWTHPDAANEWAHIHGSGAYPNTPMGEDALNRRNPVIMPVRINPRKHLDVNWLEHSKNLQSPENYNSQLMGNLINHAKKSGYDTMRIRNMSEGMSQPHDQLAVLNPSVIRSEFAQFDPARQHENDIGARKGGTVDREKVDYKQMPHSPIVEHVLGKISAPLPALDPHLLAAIAGRRS